MVIGRERGKNTIVCVAMPESILKINLSADKCEIKPISHRILLPLTIIQCPNVNDGYPFACELTCGFRGECLRWRDQLKVLQKDDVIMLV